ncbi:MAG: hypothetical protein NTU53_16550 [Planctomycetota bacterium]|nr:hypothetical protein [Planctomycetota bacterium]
MRRLLRVRGVRPGGSLTKKAPRTIDWISGLLRVLAATPLLVQLPGG